MKEYLYNLDIFYLFSTKGLLHLMVVQSLTNFDSTFCQVFLIPCSITPVRINVINVFYSIPLLNVFLLSMAHIHNT
jgi:hypothetical protein